jgi:outer membrane lipoprotein
MCDQNRFAEDAPPTRPARLAPPPRPSPSPSPRWRLGLRAPASLPQRPLGAVRSLMRFAAAGTLLMLGCAAQVPQDIRTPAPAPVSVVAVRAAPERHIGTPVRWGGSILAVQNDSSTTDIEILARPLDATGEPERSDGDGAQIGRFIARFTGFLDPAAYPEGRLLTVSGTVTGVETRDVGDYPYRYPVVRATGRHLWPAPETVFAPYPSPWRDPWYDPWYGWPGIGPWYGPGFGPWHRPWYW